VQGEEGEGQAVMSGPRNLDSIEVRQGHSWASLSLASHKRGVGSSDGVWGADWAAVVSTSPRDEASAKQVLPWRDRHGPRKEGRYKKDSRGLPCV
jgi:hypothetical protein